ncbi:hypothetical protein DCBHLPFO_00634 [Mycoplasmopsis arginini]|uniref:Uncharacterized protein n=2 Tax=Mycoplasmopsis arginini TaxID=2094 RepID=A0AA43U2Y2_MYCAR|nr:hypothetical protein [Mycoplasmopsis arginini]
MRKFKFLRGTYEFNGILLSNDMVDSIYGLCEIQIDHEKKCKEKFLLKNPHIDPSDDFGYPITSINIEKIQLPEGELSYIDNDFIDVDVDVEVGVIEHSLFFTPNGTDSNNYETKFDEDVSDYVYCVYDVVVRQNLESGELEIYDVRNLYDYEDEDYNDDDGYCEELIDYDI